jgi:hypothetical protein
VQVPTNIKKGPLFRVRRFGTWAHWSSLFEPLKNSNFKALKNYKKNM